MMQPMLDRAIADVVGLLPKLAALGPALQRTADAMLQCWTRKGKVLIAGNGGSAADAAHLAEELVVRFCKDRAGLAAISLTDSAVLTCCGNDYGYERVFARQVEALGNAGDVFIAFTTSGNSPNILRAIDSAKAKGLVTIAFLGKAGGQCRGLCDIELHVPCNLTQHVQTAHQLLYHTLCEYIDEAL